MKNTPLAEQMRPKDLSEVVGQDHLLGENGIITRAISSNHPFSILLWGPPGCGKTSIARLYANAFKLRFVSISAIFSGVADLKKIFKESQDCPLLHQKTLLFVDEIHRFNKSQQDAFLPYVENGTIVLVGATTENPSFYLNSALLSRLRTLPLYPLDASSLNSLIDKFETKYYPLPLTKPAKLMLAQLSQGDGRYLFNLIENLLSFSKDTPLDTTDLEVLLQKKLALFDKNGDQHYHLISALHKSVRGSNPDAALYWFARMLDGGEDPLFIARRLIRMASEDIGLADPQALTVSIAAAQAYEMLGAPEGHLPLAEAVVYLSLAPKSNATYTALSNATALASKTGHLLPPKSILNAPTHLMKSLGYSKNYLYDHEMPEGFSGQNYFPDEVGQHKFYYPVERGFEREMIKRINYLNQLITKRSKS